ncbi:Alpha/Beta hydrolase protein [Phlebopus sp. FC_14]|nr:Alpha/Beta hydrolase protein [Phlebopus sp. FC_14]
MPSCARRHGEEVLESLRKLDEKLDGEKELIQSQRTDAKKRETNNISAALRPSPFPPSVCDPTSNRPRTKEIIDPGYPLLEAHRSTIESIKRQTFSYRPTDLDVYYPPFSDPHVNDSESGGHPILIFFYGGGLTRGARSSSPSYLVYNNLGAFFARRGITTVIPDYRLVPSISFPEGSEDVRDALDWVVQNLSEGCRGRVFVLGHSAGGLHLSGFVFTPSMFPPSRVPPALGGIMFMGVPFEIHSTKPQFREAAKQYYGRSEKVETYQPLSLLRRMDAAYVAALPPVQNLIAESEPRAVSQAMRIFTRVFENKKGSIEERTLAGHDHVSPILALSSGFGEEWGEEIDDRIRTSEKVCLEEAISALGKQFWEDLPTSNSVWFTKQHKGYSSHDLDCRSH